MVKTGLDLFESYWPSSLKGSRVGLLVHPASVSGGLEHAIDLFKKTKKCELAAIFGPQHGLYGETQDNMVEWEGKSGGQGIPVYSLYGRTRVPTKKMLKDIDAIVVDLQDVGARYYTFIWTMELLMRACVDARKAVVVLDRPNPINGTSVEGPALDCGYSSFVGGRPIPVRHGLTIGELAGLFGEEYYPSLKLHIIEMKGWRRDMWFDKTGLHWVMPSPNMPTLDTATVYPGMCLLEGTNLSEGRGTTRPFEIFGAPYIVPDKLIREIKADGAIFRPLYFKPTFQKHAGRLCGGLQIHITDRDEFKPFRTAFRILKAIYKLYAGSFKWKRPPYEYEYEKLPIDILAGTDGLRKSIESGEDAKQAEGLWRHQCSEFQRKKRKKFLLYD